MVRVVPTNGMISGWFLPRRLAKVDVQNRSTSVIVDYIQRLRKGPPTYSRSSSSSSFLAEWQLNRQPLLQILY